MEPNFFLQIQITPIEFLTSLTFLASGIVSEAEKIAAKYPNVHPEVLDVSPDKVEHLDALIEQSDVVVSLLPYTLHPIVIGGCIRKKKNVVTASYCSPPIQALHDR